MSGEVYVNGPLDRETTSQYFLSAEAIDGGGLRAPTEIEIVVTDVNDNAPLFRRSDYEGVVREKDSSFHRPIVVEVNEEFAFVFFLSLFFHGLLECLLFVGSVALHLVSR